MTRNEINEMVTGWNDVWDADIESEEPGIVNIKVNFWYETESKTMFSIVDAIEEELAERGACGIQYNVKWGTTDGS